MGCAGGKQAEAAGGKGANGNAASKTSGTSSSNMPKKEVKAGGVSRAQFILDNPGKVQDFYDLDKKKLGEGSYGSVCKAKNKASGNIRAIKSISKAQMKNIDRFKQEIAIMKMMDHPNIIKLFESFEDHRNIYLVMELATGGELFDRIIESGHFTEVQAAVLMQQIVRAIYYMHENHVCHRDLKPENFLFMSKAAIEKNLLKIIDFGLSCKFETGKMLSTKAGTPYYVAPQVLAGKYDQLSDLWSVGVIMYVMLCGYPPFFGDTDAEVLAKVKLGNYSFNASDWKHVSEDAKNLIRHLIEMDPQKRFTAEQTLRHEWIAKKAPKAVGAHLQSNFVNKLKGFRSLHKLKKAALHIIAGQLKEEQIKAMRETFISLDENGDGQLSIAEMKEGIKNSDIKDLPHDLEKILEDVDSDGSGVIDYTEFLAATLDRHHFVQEDACWSAFRLFDKNGDGKISPEELKAVLGDDSLQDVAGAATIAQMMQEVDSNGDGVIDFAEFMQMMRGAGMG
mmetsp:Transcript_22174/g.48488  ORF Transcript_22174/g.48488 Transcript_22174/m.48488 type:complete len:507 (-) Transcript_22174:191-1711(-)